MDPLYTNMDEISWDYTNEYSGQHNYVEILAEVNQGVYEEPQKKLILAGQGGASTWVINQLNQNQGNNSPSPQPGTSRTPKKPITRGKTPRTIRDQNEKKRSSDKAYRLRLKEGRIKMQRDLEELRNENEKLKGENKMLTKNKNLAEQKLHQENSQVDQLRSKVCSLSRQSAKLRILVDAFGKKMCDNDNVDEQLKQLKDELNSLIGIIRWEDWMSEILELLNKLEALKNQNRILNVQVQALCEKNYKLQHSE